MIAAIVVPFGSYSIFSTADCLDDEDAGDFDDAAFEATALVAAVGFDRAGTLLLAVCFTVRDDLRAVFADFDFDLLVAIWLSFGSTTASCAGTDTAPPIGGRGERRMETLFARQAIQQRGRILQTTGLVNQLFDIHRNGHAFGDAPRQRASLAGFAMRAASFSLE
jgi:hypothetical protein